MGIRHKQKHNAAGFTLLEMMIAIAIGALLITLGVPSLREMMRSSQRQQISTGLFLAMNQARYEAISRNTNVLVATGSYNHPTWTAGTAWNQGWTVFIDANGNGKPDSEDDVISESDPISTDFTLSEASSALSITFRRSGRAASGRVFTLCGSTQKDSRQVVAAVSGAINLQDLQDVSAAAYAAACPS